MWFRNVVCSCVICAPTEYLSLCVPVWKYKSDSKLRRDAHCKLSPGTKGVEKQANTDIFEHYTTRGATAEKHQYKENEL